MKNFLRTKKSYYTFIGIAIFAILVVPVSMSTSNLKPVIANTSATENDITVQARGWTGEEKIELRINDSVAAAYTLSKTYQSYIYKPPTSIVVNKLEVHFINDRATPIDRNVDIDYISVAGLTYQTESARTYSVGIWNRENGCREGYKESQTIACNGFVRYAVAPGIIVVGSGTQPEPTPEPESPALAITSHSAIEITATSAKITWDNTENAQGYVDYGTTPNLGERTIGDLSFEWATHIQPLNDLLPGTEYFYQVNSTNQTGKTVSAQGKFSTPNSTTTETVICGPSDGDEFPHSQYWTMPSEPCYPPASPQWQTSSGDTNPQWICVGQSGGTSGQCSAVLLDPPTPTIDTDGLLAVILATAQSLISAGVTSVSDFIAALSAAITAFFGGGSTHGDYCGVDNGQTLSAPPTNTLCVNSATPKDQTGSGPWEWACADATGAVVETCKATPSIEPKSVIGECGSSVDTCSAGTFVSGTDSSTQDIWGCIGSDGYDSFATCASAR